eukprot:scaffold9019_cov142-Isochrysis_galbana.AAC.2
MPRLPSALIRSGRGKTDGRPGQGTGPPYRCALTPLTPLTLYRSPSLKPLHSWQLPTRRGKGGGMDFVHYLLKSFR